MVEGTIERRGHIVNGIDLMVKTSFFVTDHQASEKSRMVREWNMKS
jgi:hypothetical protein